MAELKACLKEAKNAIKDKDYEAAMIHCKDALKIERKNYQALVMFGRVCLEQHRFADSKRALLLATQIDQENPIAWQGLSSLHDKEPYCFEKEEEIAILSHLKDITKEEEKLDRIYRRLASVYQRYECPLDAVFVLESLLTILKDGAQIKEVHKSIIELLENIKEPSMEALHKLIENYKCILNESEFGENESNYQAYLRLLYKAKDLEKLMDGARAMTKIFPTAYPLEWIARAFVEYNDYSYRSDDDDEEVLISDEDLSTYNERLLRLYKGSPWGNLTLGLIYSKEGNTEASKLHLRKGCEVLGTNLSAWLSLLEVHMNSGDTSGTEATCRKMSSLLNSSSTQKLPKRFTKVYDLQQYLLLMRVNALFQIGHINHLQEAVSLLTNVENKSLETRILLVKAQVKLGMVMEACKEVDDLKDEFGMDVAVQKVTALVAYSKGDYEMAKTVYENILQEDATNAEALFELGRIYFEMKDYQKSLIFLLKAAKYDPKMSSAFLFIGHYYRLNDNFEKAKKCYEKAVNLNPSDEDAGSSLSDVYRITGQDDENFSLLLRVTNEGKSGWAWLRLGLHYLAVKNCDEAIKALQRAVEINPRDKVCYECLGDAYLSRGSHTAALKVFTKVTELHPEDSLYPRCRIAYVNHMVGELLLAISQYEQVLFSENLPNAVQIVALVGLSEVLLTRARKYKQEQLLSNLKEDCLIAIKYLTRAACENANNFTVWKLLGDACTLQACLPASLSTFDIPSRLLDASVSDVEQMQEIDKEEMLVLGGRCYGVGLQVNNSNPSLWHDLGVNIFLQGHSTLKLCKVAKMSPDEDKRDSETIKDFVQRALAAVKKSLSFDPTSYNVWNSLGTITYFKGDYPLAQHAFIRSLQLHPTVDAWTHLGALYLNRKDIHLAHEAFSQAQALDPVFVTSWVGQAMVATSVGHYEAFDLYRHTTILGFHPESCVGFASNVLQLACDKSPLKTPKDVDHFIPNVVDSLTYYTREKEDDAIAQNMLGLTLEMMGLNESASLAFSKAVEASKENDNLGEEIRDGILYNYSRILTSLNKLPDAITNYSKLKEPDFYSQCGLALSQLKASQFDDAYQRYSEAYEWFAPDDAQKSNVLVALAFLQYKFQKIEEVKTLLFQSSSIQGLLALTSLGLIQGDATLTGAALAELEPYADSKEYAHHVTFLKATQATFQSNHEEAKLILSRAIHRHPDNSALWRFLSRHLLSSPTKTTSANRIAEAANAAANASRALAQAAGDNDNVFQDVVLKAVAHLKASLVPPPEVVGKRKKREAQRKKQNEVKNKAKDEMTKEMRRKLSLAEAQRAVLMCPSKPETWSVLIASIDSKPKMSELAKKWSKEAKPVLKSWLENVSCL